MADDVSYRRLYEEFRQRDNFDAVFGRALDDVQSAVVDVDFDRVQSCVAFGTGSGEREMEFARRLLPNLRSFTAVEPDPESVEALRANFRGGRRLPVAVETSVMETSIERWIGVDNHVDAVLLFNVLSHVQTADRRELFHKLTTRYLSQAGLVAVSGNVSSARTGTALLMERLGAPSADYGEFEAELRAEGFRVAFKQDLKVHRDLSNPGDGVVKFIQMRTGHRVGESEIRTAIDEIFSQPNMDFYTNRLTIFTKQIESACVRGASAH